MVLFALCARADLAYLPGAAHASQQRGCSSRRCGLAAVSACGRLTAILFVLLLLVLHLPLWLLLLLLLHLVGGSGRGRVVHTLVVVRAVVILLTHSQLDFLPALSLLHGHFSGGRASRGPALATSAARSRWKVCISSTELSLASKKSVAL